MVTVITAMCQWLVAVIFYGGKDGRVAGIV